MLCAVNGGFIVISVSCGNAGPVFDSRIGQHRIGRTPVGFGLIFPFGRIGRRDEIVALRRAGQVFPLAVAAAQTERYVCRPGEIHDLQRYGIGPEVVAFFRNRNQSLQTVGRRNFVAAAVGVFHMDRHGVVAAR